MRKSKRLNPDADARSEKGCYKKRCCSSIHWTVGNDNQIVFIDLKSRRKIKTSDYETLIVNGIITPETNYICKRCFTHAIGPSNDNVLVPSNTSETESESDDDLPLKCHELSIELASIIKDDVLEIFKHNKEVKHLPILNSYEPRSWLLSRPRELILLFSNLCQVDMNTAGTAKLNIISKIVELIYYCRNSKLVLPNHFIESLLNYSFTNSKTYASFLGNRSPGGSYTYIMSWLNEQANNPIKFPKGLTKAIFDNNQKIGKTHIITGTNIIPTSVMTSSLWLSLDSNNQIQDDERFKPSKWMWKETNQDTEKKLIDALTSPGNDFGNTRDEFITICIDIVTKQHKRSIVPVTDSIDVFLQNKNIVENQKKCVNCGCESDIDYRVCRNCGGKLIKETVKEPQFAHDEHISPYKCFDLFKSSLPDIKCITGEPDFINPNGYEAIVQVIQNIGFRAGIKQYGNGTREWLLVECDGLPFNILREIIANVWRCSQCNDCHYGIERYQDHKCFILQNNEPVREFGWLVPVSGLFHLELNLSRAFIKLNWEVFASKLGTVLGFKTPRAQEYLKKGSDHHKSWHFLEILYVSLSLELVVHYVKDSIASEEQPTITGYWKWCEDIEDPNYIYIQHAIFTHLHALMMLRAGI